MRNTGSRRVGAERSVLEQLEPILAEVVLANSVRDWLTSAAVVLLTVVLGRALRGWMARLAKRVTQLTESEFDDRLIDGSAGPASALIVLAGFHFAVAILEMPGGLRSFLQRGLLIAAAVLLTVVGLRAIDALFGEIVRPWLRKAAGGADEQLVRYGRFFLKLLVVVTAAVMVLERVGLNVMSLVTGLGIGGMAVALAAQETLGNVLGSFQILTDRPFSVGDWVLVGEHMGVVQEIGLRSTKILKRGNILVVIPNKTIAQVDLQNLSVGGDLAVEIDLGLVYGTTADQMEQAIELLHDILGARTDVADHNLLHFLQFADFALVIRCTYYVLDLDRYWDVQHAVNLAIKRRFDAEGLDFAFPTRTVHIAEAEAGGGGDANPSVGAPAAA